MEALGAAPYVPRAHGTQLVALAYLEWYPWAQSWHTVAPMLAANSPGAHAVHVVAPAAEKDPGLHVSHLEDPVLAMKPPAGQLVQLALPSSEACFPTAHLVHAVTPRVLAYLPMPHVVHLDCPPRATHLPLAHGVHAEAPPPEIFPATHSAQALCPPVET